MVVDQLIQENLIFLMYLVVPVVLRFIFLHSV